MNTDIEVTLHFFCGKMAAGKSTLARRLAEPADTVLLVEDELLGALYREEIVGIPSYIEYSSRLKNAISEHICALLAAGISVVLDFPANTLNQRKWFRSLYETAQVAHKLHFVDASDERCKRQLRERSKDLPTGAPFTNEADFDNISKYFQAPSQDEGFNIIRYERRD